MRTEADGVMTVEDVATYFRVHTKTIYRLASSKKIPGFKIGGTWRFYKDDILAWAKKNIQAPQIIKE